MIGIPNADNPAAQGLAMIILNLIPDDTFFFHCATSPSVKAATALGIIEDATAVEIAIGTLHSSRYFELYIPTRLLTNVAEAPLDA